MLLNFQGETGPYIQYIYVRTKSILNKVNYIPKIDEIDYSKLLDEESINVLANLYKFSEVIKNAAQKNEPSILARYLIDLAQSFSSFYNEHKIVTDNLEEQNARVFLTYSVGLVLKIGMQLLGIEMPDKM